MPASVALYWPTNPAASLGRNDRSSMPDEHLTSCSAKGANVWLRCSESTELLVHLLSSRKPLSGKPVEVWSFDRGILPGEHVRCRRLRNLVWSQNIRLRREVGSKRGHATPDSCGWLKGPFRGWPRNAVRATVSSNTAKPPCCRFSAVL